MIRIDRATALSAFSIFCVFASGVWFLFATAPGADNLSWMYLFFFVSQSALFAIAARDAGKKIGGHPVRADRHPAQVYPAAILPFQRGEYVYLAQDIDATRYVKIGYTNDLHRRFGEFGVTLPFRVRCIHYFQCRDRRAAEIALHQRYKEKRVSGEWFRLSDADIKELMKTKYL